MRTLDTKEINQLNKMLKQRKARGANTLRAVIYARKSAEDEKQTSLPTQISLCKKLIESYDFLTLTHIYQEDNVSGMFTDGRIQYKEMMQQAERQEIDVIVVMKLDRLARDLADSTTAVKLLKAYGCHLIAGDDVSNPNTPEGEFLRSILLAEGQFHARRVASDVMATECKNAKEGLSAGGIAPYGLKIVNQRFEINDKEAEAIKLLFTRYTTNHSYKQIIDELDSLGYKTRSGNKFSYSTINAMLKNDKYYGTYVYNREGSKRKKNRVLNEDFDEVRNSNTIPPIISKELFEQAQKITLSHIKCRPKQNANPSFALTGYVFCKNCGKSMSGASNHGGRNKSKRRTYCCPNHSSRNGNICNSKAINADYLEDTVKSIITDSINDLIAKQNSNVLTSKVAGKLKEEANHTSRLIADTKSKVSRLLDRAVNSSSELLSSTYESQAEELLKTIPKYEQKLTDINSRISNINICLDNQIKLMPSDIFKSPDVLRELTSIYIDRIEIDDSNDNIEIKFNT